MRLCTMMNDNMRSMRFGKSSTMHKIRRSIFFASLALSVGLSPIVASSADVDLAFNRLAMSDCATESGILVLKYTGIETGSPYATEFDRREVSVALSDNPALLLRRTGAKRTKRGIFFQTTLLASPPNLAQIKKRRMLPNSVRAGKWRIFTEDIQYAAQGPARGFQIECETAVQLGDSGEKTVAVSECFGYENKQRFLSTLTQIDTKAVDCGGKR